jgi:hypothetical protein
MRCPLQGVSRMFYLSTVGYGLTVLAIPVSLNVFIRAALHRNLRKRPVRKPA